MDLVSLLIVVIVMGLLCYLITLLPLPAPYRQIAQVVLVLILILWLLGGGTLGHIGHLRFGR